MAKCYKIQARAPDKGEVIGNLEQEFDRYDQVVEKLNRMFEAIMKYREEMYYKRRHYTQPVEVDVLVRYDFVTTIDYLIDSPWQRLFHITM